MRQNSIFFLLVIGPVLAIALGVLGLLTVCTNILGWFLMFIGILYPSGLLIISIKHKRKYWIAPPVGEIVKEETGDQTFWVISLAMMIAFFLPPLEFLYFEIPLFKNQWVQFIGLIFLIIGASLFVWVRRTIGTSFSGHIATVEGQPLVQNGPYKLIRHPGYAAYLLISIGISAGYSSLAGTLSIIFLLIPALVMRIRVEEEVLVSHFGEQYKQYKSRTNRLIPWVW